MLKKYLDLIIRSPLKSIQKFKTVENRIICPILIIFEIIFRGKGLSVGDFCFAYFLVTLYLVFVTFIDVVEKYLLEYDFMSPFITLILESTFGLILVSIFHPIIFLTQIITLHLIKLCSL